jgi:hypothetical protein
VESEDFRRGNEGGEMSEAGLMNDSSGFGAKDGNLGWNQWNGVGELARRQSRPKETTIGKTSSF